MKIRIFKLTADRKISDFKPSIIAIENAENMTALRKNARKVAKENAPSECAGYYVEIFNEDNMMQFGNFEVTFK